MSQAGYIVFKEPWNAPWGQRYAIIKDVDANLISLFALYNITKNAPLSFLLLSFERLVQNGS